jgi:hypothetical protein
MTRKKMSLSRALSNCPIPLTVKQKPKRWRSTIVSWKNGKNEIALKYRSKKIVSHELQSGLLISLAPRSDKDLGAVNIILCKQDCGTDAIARKKARDKVVKALEPKIAAGNISCMLTSDDATNYDVAADTLSWQTTLKSISCFCQ